jgi:hypothetical protein
MPNEDTHDQHIIWQLVFASPKAIGILCDFDEQLRGYRARLDEALTLITADEVHFDRLERLRLMLFGDVDLCEFFPSHKVEEALRVFVGRGNPNSTDPFVVDSSKALRFQLDIFLLRMSADFLAGVDLYGAHRNTFNRQYSKICIRSDFTGEMNWKAAKEATESILLSEFDDRFASYCIQGEAYYQSRLHNEALTIAYLVSDSARQAGCSVPSKDSGVEFERECAELLSRLGYTVQKTKRSGDFGVDIIAQRTSLSFAIQSKCHSQPVGISGIQEVLGGRKHYRTDYSVVISASGFTTAARELASSSRVILANVRDLENLDALARNLDHGAV